MRTRQQEKTSTNSTAEVLAVPLLNSHRLRLEVAQIIKVQFLVLAVELGSSFFAVLDDGFDVSVDQPAMR